MIFKALFYVLPDIVSVCVWQASVCYFQFVLIFLKFASIFEHLQNHYAALDHLFQSNCSSSHLWCFASSFGGATAQMLEIKSMKLWDLLRSVANWPFSQVIRGRARTLLFESASCCTQAKVGHNPQNASRAHHYLLSEIQSE
jgi:hypothetical protein